MSYVLRFYWRVLKKAGWDSNFRSHLLEELWQLVRQYLPARLITRRKNYIYCLYVGARRPGQARGRWLPPLALRYRFSVYGVLLDGQDRVLLVADPSLDFGWSLPGGGIN